jgi:hypothetical protein
MRAPQPDTTPLHTVDCRACLLAGGDHVKAHPDLGCSDVGCNNPHPEPLTSPQPEPSVRDQVAEALTNASGLAPIVGVALADVLAAAGLLRADPVDGTVTEVEWRAVGVENGVRYVERGHTEAEARAVAEFPAWTAQSRTTTRGPWEDA